ncbi:MAG: hypothetical protein RMJ28_02305 [Nitrososphaerota archaeon]|nr:hypothetical protein [Candidatus Calditenuaceae archaeon]MDW8073054.1 hypothetical protein [Nitrososphaerota archaeon]
MEPDEAVYLARIVLAIAVGYVCGTFPVEWLYGLLLGIGVYASSIPLVMLLYRGGRFISRRAAATSGIGAYAFTWLMIWILVYNLSIS